MDLQFELSTVGSGALWLLAQEGLPIAEEGAAMVKRYRRELEAGEAVLEELELREDPRAGIQLVLHGELARFAFGLAEQKGTDVNHLMDAIAVRDALNHGHVLIDSENVRQLPGTQSELWLPKPNTNPAPEPPAPGGGGAGAGAGAFYL